MNSLVLYALLALGVSPAAADTANLDSAQLEEGTLIFLENCNSFVEFSTGGEIGHVALAFTDGSEAFIYEATPAQVRRVSVAQYYAELARLNARRDADDKLRVLALRPKKAYTDAEVAKMRAYLDGQVGRRYSVRNYVRRTPGDGIHCAELASTTLNQTGRHEFENCHRIHPQALYSALEPLSAAPQELAIAPPAAKETWCVRSQRRCGEWFTWCGWSCQEAWAWCW